MQKAFKDIIEGLEENGQKMSEAKTDVPFGKHSPSNHRYYKAISVKKAIEIVNQVAEKHEQEVCEYKDYVERERVTGYYEPSCNEENLLSIFDTKRFKYCPYCGKEIKVV